MKQQRGSALALVVGTAAVLFILTAVVYTYFQMNARASLFRMNRIRAATAAEAGTALALHHLASLESIPEDGEPFLLEVEGDSSGWMSLGDGVSFFVVIDPVNGMSGLCRNGAVEVRSRGLAGDVTRDIELRTTPAYPSSYALLTDNGIPEGYFVDGRVVNGPVHSNGLINFSSYSPDSTGDPYASMVSTAQSGMLFSGAGLSDVAHPQGSSIWVRPYTLHRQGSPYWRTSVPEIDFVRLNDHFRGLVTGSVRSDAVRISAERILIEGDHLLYKENQNATERVLSLAEVDLVVVRNGFSSVTVKTVRRPERPLTIIAANNMIIGGEIDGGAVGSGGPLGLVALGNIVIAADPDETGGEDWSGRWDIETDRGFLVRASLVAPSGSFQAETPYIPREKSRVSVTGSLVERSMGRMSSGDSGYQLGNTWDQGLGALHPPYFPMLGCWNVYSWIIDPPELEGFEIEEDRI